MRRAALATVLLTLTIATWLASENAARQRVIASSSGGRIIPKGGGDHVVRRWGVPAVALVNPDNAGTRDFVAISESVPSGGGIPVHRHPNAEELIVVQQGTAIAIVGDVRQEVTAGATIYVPRGEWHGMENRGSQVQVLGVFSQPGYHTYFSATSVSAGQRVTPLSDNELRAVRERFKDVIEFKAP
jgi:quercetin dioxygenase-like cupin family protein